MSKIIIMLLVICLGFPASTGKLVASKADETVVDLTMLTNDEIARKLDKSPTTQDFIVLNGKQLKQLKGYLVTEVVAKEDFSNVNSTMWGKYGVYKVNGHYVFCIEPGYDTLNSAKKVDEDKSVYGEFAQSSKTYISRVISSALDNYKKTNNVDFIFAGQLLIWDYVSTYEADVIGNAMESWNPEYLNSWTISKSVYAPQIKVIENDLRDWTILPSFLDPTLEHAKGQVLKYDKSKDEFTLTLKDTNGVWDEKYANYEQVGNYKLSNPIGKDNVRISTSNEQTSYAKPVDFTWNPYISEKKELYDAGQDFIYVGALPVKGFMKFKTEPYPKGGFELKKVGEQPNGGTVALKGVDFKVTGGEFEKVYTTDSDGEISVTDELTPGKYHIKEISAPSKYHIDFEQNFNVEPGKVTKINSGKLIVNNLYYNKIKFMKLGQSFENGNSETSALAGVKFELYKEGRNANQVIDGDDVLVEELMSNQEGIVESDKLYEGDYILKEVETLPGYVLNNQTYSFKVSNDNKVLNKATIDLGSITNEVVDGRARLEKIGVGSCEQIEECSIPLEGVKFNVYADSNSNGTFDEDEHESITQIITDEDGKGISEPLKYGHYYLKETENPNINYQMSNTIYQFDISEPDQIVDINGGKPIQNSEKTGSVEIVKHGESLSNANEDIYALAGATYQIRDEQEKVVGELTTDDFGKASLDNLSYGKYKIKETKAPEGYELDSTVYEFEINEDTYKQPINLKFSDDVIKNKIEVNKVDAGGEKLAGASLVVKDRNTGEVVEEWVSTAESHIFEINYGKYKICETMAPPGYKQATKCINFDVTKSGVNQSFELVNKRMEMAITGGSAKRNWIIMLLGLILVVLMILYTRFYFHRVK